MVDTSSKWDPNTSFTGDVYIPWEKDFEIHSSCGCEIGAAGAEEENEIGAEEEIDFEIGCSFENRPSSVLVPAAATGSGSSPFLPY